MEGVFLSLSRQFHSRLRLRACANASNVSVTCFASGLRRRGISVAISFDNRIFNAMAAEVLIGMFLALILLNQVGALPHRRLKSSCVSTSPSACTLSYSCDRNSVLFICLFSNGVVVEDNREPTLCVVCYHHSASLTSSQRFAW